MIDEQTTNSSSHHVLSNMGFDVDVNEAVQLLGVSRTRLSQLVSKGVLGFERRRVDTRMRMFLSRTELLSYLRRQMSGASARVQHNQWMFESETTDAEPVSTTVQRPFVDVVESEPRRAYVPMMRHGARPNDARQIAVPKASALNLRLQAQHEAQRACEQLSFRQDLKNESRALEKKFQQLRLSNETTSRPLASALSRQTEKKESQPEATPRRKIRSLARRSARRVGL